MKTKQDIKIMKKQEFLPYKNALDWFIEDLKNEFMTREDSSARIMKKLAEWDTDCKKFFLTTLVKDKQLKKLNTDSLKELLTTL